MSQIVESGSKPCHFLAEWPWASHMTTLPLYFLLYKVEIITIMRTAAILIILSWWGLNSGVVCLEQHLAHGKSSPSRVPVLSSFPLTYNFCSSCSFKTRHERVVTSYIPSPTQWGIGALHLSALLQEALAGHSNGLRALYQLVMRLTLWLGRNWLDPKQCSALNVHPVKLG